MNPTLLLTLGFLLTLAVIGFLCTRFLRPFHRRAIVCLTAVLLSALVVTRHVGKTRFEIILPTGGAHQARIEEQAWANLLTAVRDKPEWKTALAKVDLSTVPPGREHDLVIRVRQELSWAALKDKLREK